MVLLNLGLRRLEAGANIRAQGSGGPSLWNYAEAEQGTQNWCHEGMSSKGANRA